jgi:SHS2 domain-containing protein
MSEGPAFEFVDDVTSDLSFVARGATLPEVFRAAAEALLHATLEAPEMLREVERRRVELAEPDLELLLLRFLNELVYLRDAEALLLRPGELQLEQTPAGDRLVAELAGERIDPARHVFLCEVKAATAHGLAVVAGPDGYRATVTLDV